MTVLKLLIVSLDGPPPVLCGYRSVTSSEAEPLHSYFDQILLLTNDYRGAVPLHTALLHSAPWWLIVVATSENFHRLSAYTYLSIIFQFL